MSGALPIGTVSLIPTDGSAILVAFTPSAQSVFSFQATFDGAPYNISVTWNVSGQRWYVNMTDQSSDLIVSLPMIGSPPYADISLTAGYFNTTLVFREATQTFEISVP